MFGSFCSMASLCCHKMPVGRYCKKDGSCIFLLLYLDIAQYQHTAATAHVPFVRMSMFFRFAQHDGPGDSGQVLSCVAVGSVWGGWVR